MRLTVIFLIGLIVLSGCSAERITDLDMQNFCKENGFEYASPIVDAFNEDRTTRISEINCYNNNEEHQNKDYSIEEIKDWKNDKKFLTTIAATVGG